MRRRQASELREAGESPKNTPASLPDPLALESKALEIRAAASHRRRRSNLRAAFWRCSAAGFMLGSHEASVSCLAARVALRDVGIRHDLRACRERRHEDV